MGIPIHRCRHKVNSPCYGIVPLNVKKMSAQRSLVECAEIAISCGDLAARKESQDFLGLKSERTFLQSRLQGHQRNRLQTEANRGTERQRVQLHHDRQNGHRSYLTSPRSHVAAGLAPRPLETTHRTPTLRSRRSIHGASSRGSFYLGCSRGALSCSAVSLFHERPNINKGGHGGATVDPGGAAKARVVSPRHGHGEKGCTGPFSMPEESEAVMECTFPPSPNFPPHR